MAFLNTTTPITAPFGLRIRQIFAGLKTRLRQHRMYRETFDGLSALTNRELADLGLHRSELRFVARQAAQRV